ncbi:hypothetical protein SDC9_112315 [bioreactor metagenome]|uniref:Uncharacterized protein n=1 Tax=bioreactor metagenome TaxID=1076179 RepID=A0A645BIX9_9ZZZZ
MSKRVRPEAGSNRATRVRPLSTTTRTPSMVRLLSAMAVASTILRNGTLQGRMARRCSARSSLPYKGRIIVSGSAICWRNRSSTRRISASPGKNTSMLPVSSRHARITNEVTSDTVSRASWRSKWRIATGKQRPSPRRIGTPPNSAATASHSSVADIASSFRSERNERRTSSVKASARSA